MKMRSFEFSIDSELFRLVPGYERVVVVARRSGPGEVIGVSAALRAGIERCHERVERAGGVTELPEVQAWRAAFRAVGFDPTRTRPAVEALARRAAKGDELALGNPVIDIGTAVSLAHGMPIGIHTLDEVDEPLVLDKANGNEEFVQFSGKKETPDVGEWVYRSGNRVLTRRWAWKQGSFGSVTDADEHLAVNIDCIGGVSAVGAVKNLENYLDTVGFKVTAILKLSAASSMATAQ